MVGLILRILSRFYEPAKKLLVASRSSTRNFAIFVATIAFVNVLIRSVLFWTFATPENIQIVNRIAILLTMTSCSVVFSVFIFYIQSNYPTLLRRILSRLIDFERRDENRIRREELVRELQIQFPNVKFDHLYIFLPLVIMWPIFTFELSPTWLHFMLGWFIWIYAISLIFYLRNVQKIVFERATIPTELLYIPSKREVLWWDLKFMAWEAIQGILYGENRTKGSRTESEYYQRKLKTAKNYNTFSRSFKNILFYTTLFGSIAGLEACIFSHPELRPSQRLFWKMYHGYYSDRVDVINEAFTLEGYGCDMATFCYPGTKKLDHTAVATAYKELKNSRRAWYENGVYMTSKEPLPAGPYHKLSIVDGKESTSIPTHSSTTPTAECKEPSLME